MDHVSTSQHAEIGAVFLIGVQEAPSRNKRSKKRDSLGRSHKWSLMLAGHDKWKIERELSSLSIDSRQTLNAAQN